MSKERAPHMPWYGREFYSDENVLVMTLEQEGAYLRLLWNCWQEGSMPADTAKLAALCKNTPVRKFERDIWPALAGLFSPAGDRLVHRKVEQLRDAKEAFRGACSAAGKIGNEKRWGKYRVPDGTATETRQIPESGIVAADCRLPIADCQIPNQRPNACASGDARSGDSPEVITEPDELFPVEGSKPAKSVDGLISQQDLWFTEWWDAYWLHKARKPARRAFAKHVKTAARFQQVMEATRAQSPDMLGREPQHRPHGATWLNGERWNDEPAPQPKSQGDRIREILNAEKGTV